MIRFLLTSLIFGLFAPRLFAAENSDTIISLVTVFPGEEIYELEGHSAIRVKIQSENSLGPSTDIAVNFGLFDFNAPNFVYRYVKGETDYMVGAYPWVYFVESYDGSGRKIVEQQLNLTSAQKNKLLQLLSVQLTPPNNQYRYNYVLDNCATRPLDFILKASEADTASIFPNAEIEKTSFRKEMRRFHKNYPWYQFGIDLALGSLIDKPITSRQKCFAPVTLFETIEGTPLVEKTVVIVDGNENGAADGPTPFLLTPLAFAILILIITLGVTFYDYRNRRMSRGFDAIMFGIFGLVGLLIFFLVFFSEHYATSPNLVALWLNPFCFIPTIFIWKERTRRWVGIYQTLNCTALLAVIVAWAFNFQSLNPAFIPLIASDFIRGLYFIRYGIYYR